MLGVWKHKGIVIAGLVNLYEGCWGVPAVRLATEETYPPQNIWIPLGDSFWREALEYPLDEWEKQVTVSRIQEVAENIAPHFKLRRSDV